MDLHNYTYQSDFAKKYVAQGIEQGIAQGIQEILRTLLAQRFGELPADVGARLDKADADTLRTWTRRVLPATALADVFLPEPR